MKALIIGGSGIISSAVSALCLQQGWELYLLNRGLTGDKSNSVIFDNSKVKRAVPSFTAKVRFDQGVRQALEYILNHPECQVSDPEFDAWSDSVIRHYERMVKDIPILAVCRT